LYSDRAGFNVADRAAQLSWTELRYTGSMRHAIAIITAFLLTIVAANAQTEKKPRGPKTVTISGCVERDETTPDQFTVTDAQEGVKYRVTGKDFREYVGRRVELDGGLVVKGVKIRGGLQPNPNVAAQAGAIDPSRAAVQAATSGPSLPPSAEDVQEFRVKTLRAAAGACKPE
jgi:hypothetical protein